jgi:hypothetical protein
MATEYVVLQENKHPDDVDNDYPPYKAVATVEAANAEKACRIVAEKMSDESLENGVTLIAVPARNWTSGRNTFKAETRRRLLRS